jgi:hypothetical protein
MEDFKMLKVMSRLFITLTWAASALGANAELERHDDIRRFKASEYSSSRKVINSVDRHGMAARVDRSIDKMVSVSTYFLRREGYEADASRIEIEYGLLFKRYVSRLVAGEKDLGDYAPLSAFLTRLSETLDEKLGSEIMELTHLEDVRIVNYTVPVVFHLSTIPAGAISPAEYKKHFVPLTGVTAFWGVSIACDIGTVGTGYWFICSPAGVIAKFLVVEYIAPPAAPRWYNFFYD